MDQFTKEGRKLRPRKSAQSAQGYEKVEYHHSDRREGGNNYSEAREGAGERRSFNRDGGSYSGGERRSYNRSSFGEHRNYGERRSYSNDGERRSYGHDSEHRSYSNFGGDRREGGERRSFNGESRPRSYSERNGFSKPYGERRSFSHDGENREGGYERRSFGGDRREGGFGGERRSFKRDFNGGSREGGFGGERRSSGRSSFGERKSYGDRPQFGGRKPMGKKKFGGKKPEVIFGKDTYEGINRMIDRRPVVNDRESDERYDSPIQNVIRLNKFIANSGVCSRREADTLIMAGVVTVNGEVITELGTKVNVIEDDIRFNGERLHGEEKVYIIMNKPKGFVTSASDPHADKTVIDLVKACPARVYPVGRLDKNTTGVLLLTNDGEIAERLTHPSYDKKKIYQVALDRELSQEDYDKVLAGVELSDGVEKADELEYIDANDKRKLGIEIHSGKNRIVRRLFETLGYTVKALDRVYFAGVTKKGLKRGEWRYLTEGESNILKMGAYV